MKENKGLTDKELVAKYEAGIIYLAKVLQKATSKNQFTIKKEILKIKEK